MCDDTFDYVIVGAGPSGLTLAYYLSKYGKKVLLIEKESTIGGCHRVRRINGLFTEHGPRVIIGNYFALSDLLTSFGKTFDDMYTKYHSTVLRDTISELKTFEIVSLIWGFFKFFFFDNKASDSLYEFAIQNNFTKNTIQVLDTLCRTVDGGTIKNFTIKEFFELANQNLFYNIYQPRLPNDVGLFKDWKKALEQNKVDTLMNTTITKINTTQVTNTLNSLEVQGGFNISAKNYIFAIPPEPMLHIISQSSDKNTFGDYSELVKWEQQSRYLVYIPITFHWASKVKIIKPSHLIFSDYGIVYIVMSDYMHFDDERSKTVITCSVKVTDNRSAHNQKTANECDKQELISEVFRQLKEQQPFLPQPDFSLLSPGVYKDKKMGKWITDDTAYFYTKAGYRPNISKYNNLFWIGCHNGNSNYSFTAMETAIENAISLLHQIVPESRNEVHIHQPVTIKTIILATALFLISYYTIRKSFSFSV